MGGRQPVRLLLFYHPGDFHAILHLNIHAGAFHLVKSILASQPEDHERIPDDLPSVLGVGRVTLAEGVIDVQSDETLAARFAHPLVSPRHLTFRELQKRGCWYAGRRHLEGLKN